MPTATGPRLKTKYETELRPALREELGLGNVMEVPRLVKIVLNCGVGRATQQASLLDGAVTDLTLITGQKPLVTKAKKSIAGFKLREGNAIGAKVTLRGARMWEFYDRLVSVAIPRIRDFRGLDPRSFDGRGNYTFGVTEQLIFPEIDYDTVDETRGFDITITTTAPTDEEAFELLLALGMPFAKEGRPTAEGRAEREAAEAAAAAEAAEKAEQAEALKAQAAEIAPQSAAPAAPEGEEGAADESEAGAEEAEKDKEGEGSPEVANDQEQEG
jgi:large subunit ribosomal protein L5